MVVLLMILDSLEELQKTQLAHKQEHFLTFNGHKTKSHPCALHCITNDAGWVALQFQFKLVQSVNAQELQELREIWTVAQWLTFPKKWCETREVGHCPVDSNLLLWPETTDDNGKECFIWVMTRLRQGLSCSGTSTVELPARRSHCFVFIVKHFVTWF